MPKEYLYRVANKTPGAPDRLVIANLPGQALRFVTEDTLSVELCDGLTAAELVKAGVPVERAVPADKPEPSPAPPQQQLVAQQHDPSEPHQPYQSGILGEASVPSTAALA